MLIKAREDSWLSISVDGEIVTRALLTAPAQKSVRAENEIVIRAGNVGALDFEFNGTEIAHPGRLRRSQNPDLRLPTACNHPPPNRKHPRLP